MVDKDGTILAHNKYFNDERGWGWPIEGYSNFEVWTKDYLNSIGATPDSIEDSIQSLRDNTPGEWERTIPDGRTFTILHIALENGGYVRTFNDITERKKADDELKLKMKETEAFNKVAVGRELKMIELKKEINDLHEESGGDKKYNIV